MATATEMIALYIEAEKAVLTGKTVEINGRRLSRENLADIRAGRMEWERRLKIENNMGKGHSLASFY